MTVIIYLNEDISVIFKQSVGFKAAVTVGVLEVFYPDN